MVSPKVRNFVLNRQNNKCGLCKSTFSKMVPHELHRLNHNARDLNVSNLVALCSNCHGAHHRYNIPVYTYFELNNSFDNHFNNSL